jgi:hypothetical protein
VKEEVVINLDMDMDMDVDMGMDLRMSMGLDVDGEMGDASSGPRKMMGEGQLA